MAATLTTKFDASNIQDIADLILFELSRRPSVSIPNNTTNKFNAGNKITASDMNLLVKNLAAAGQTITAPSAGSSALKTFG
jgi:hypothetical protein